MNTDVLTCERVGCRADAVCRLVETMRNDEIARVALCEQHRIDFLNQFDQNAIAMQSSHMLRGEIRRVEMAWLVEYMNKWCELCLMDKVGGEYLVARVGFCDGAAVSHVVERKELQRPFTHRLLYNVITACGFKVSRVTITNRHVFAGNDIFEANLTIARGSEVVNVTIRPSDAVCLTVMAGEPLFAVAKVFEQTR